MFRLALAGRERGLSVKIAWHVKLGIKNIRAAFVVSKHKINDRFMRFLRNRDTKEFWLGWKSQYGSHGNSETVISECSSINDIVKGFFTSFK